jgi:hypothetical protein
MCGHTNEVWITPTFENSVMEISFISLLAISYVLATCFFVIRHALIKYFIILSVIFKIMDFLNLLLAFGMIIYIISVCI